tara:strand:- start:368 stop:766 length:399 start_codon:yes stop_codon:yes gene_type:complete
MYLFNYNYMAFFHLDIKQPFHAITAASNTHTVDLNKKGNNYSITAGNATNTITFSNLDSAKIGKGGTILITNPSSVNSLGWAGLQSEAYTPGGSTINFDTTANAIAAMTYLVIASNKILINYVGAFDSYPQP